VWLFDILAAYTYFGECTVTRPKTFCSIAVVAVLKYLTAIIYLLNLHYRCNRPDYTPGYIVSPSELQYILAYSQIINLSVYIIIILFTIAGST